MSFQRSWFPVVATLLLTLAVGCSRKSTLEPYPPITDPLVFGDASGTNVGFQAFLGSKLDGLTVDSTVKYLGTASLKAVVPNPGDPSGGYTGGAFVTSRARDLSGYNALSFWVKANRPISLDVAGLGNDNTGRSRLTAQRSAIPVTTNWTQVFIPIPLPARLSDERGMFFFAEGPENGVGLTLWFDEIRFVNTASVTNPRPVLVAQTIDALVGATLSLDTATRTTFNISGADQTVTHLPGYFTFESTNPAVATVTAQGLQLGSQGSATITAKLGTISAPASIVVNATAPPVVAAPTPTIPAVDVISLFSGAYPNVTVDTWSADWDQANLADVNIAGNPTKVYTSLLYSGILFESHPIDATAMTHLHLDVWTPGGTTFKVKLVDFGADGIYSLDDDSESELTFNAASSPPLSIGTWTSLDIPLAGFGGLLERAHLAQMVLSGDTRTVFVDNVYFHQ